MKIGAKIAIGLAAIGFGLIIWGAIVEAGNEIYYMNPDSCITHTVVCDRGNKYMTIYSKYITNGDSLVAYRYQHGGIDTVQLIQGTSFPAPPITFWIAGADSVRVDKDHQMWVMIIRSTER